MARTPAPKAGQTPEDYRQELAAQRALAREQRRHQRQLQREEQRERRRAEFLTSGHLIAEHGKSARWIDALVTIVVAMGAVLWTASRDHQTGSDILWALFWILLGGVMAVEAKEGSELQFAGGATAAANAAYLALRLTGGIEPHAL